MQVLGKEFCENFFFLESAVGLKEGCRFVRPASYLPASAGSRTIKAAIQKAIQIKKFLVSATVGVGFMGSPRNVSLRCIQGASRAPYMYVID